MAVQKKDDYKYEPLDQSGNDYASMAGMSELDRAALDAAGYSWQKSRETGDQAGMDAAHNQAEAIRKMYGYSGGADGSQYIPTKREGFSYSDAPSYVSRYQDQIDGLTSEILSRKAFEYNAEEDSLYQQYRDTYTREGQRAMEDTLAEVSARTGGLASSYAGSAAQQTYDNYMSALADKIPELRQLAYSMYQDEGNTQRANLEMLVALEQGDYARYADLLAQYNTDRSFDYGVFSDQRNYDYQVGRDAISDSRYEDETAYNRATYASETEYNQALQKAQTLAAAGDFSGYKALGYSDAEVSNLKSAYDREQAAARLTGSGSSGSKSGGSSSSSKGSNGTSASENLYAGMYEAGIRSEGDAYAWLLSRGYNTTQAGKLSGYYSEWMEGNISNEGGQADPEISNRHGDSWIYIPGHGRFSYQEVYNYVESGKIIETYDEETNTVNYKWYTNKKEN